jgi:hypothetical protein
MAPRCHSSAATSFQLPVCHKRTTPSSPPVARQLPSGVKQSALTDPACAARRA